MPGVRPALLWDIYCARCGGVFEGVLLYCEWDGR